MMFSSSALLGCQNGAGTVTYTVSASSKSCWEVIFQCQDRQLTVAPDRSRTHWTHYSLFAYVSVTEIQVSMYRVYKSLELNIWSTTRCFVTISPIKLHAPTAGCVSINIPSTFLKQIRKWLVLFRKHLQNQVVSWILCQSTLLTLPYLFVSMILSTLALSSSTFQQGGSPFG